jgi:hypothetical protein
VSIRKEKMRPTIEASICEEILDLIDFRSGMYETVVENNRLESLANEVTDFVWGPVHRAVWGCCLFHNDIYISK